MDFPGHFEQIFQQLNYQRVHGQLCDCVIVVGSRHFKAHRSVLAACSTHFRALFTVAEGDASMNMIQLDSEVRWSLKNKNQYNIETIEAMLEVFAAVRHM